MIVDSALYQHGVRVGGRLAFEDVPAARKLADAFVWLGMYEPTTEEFSEARVEFGLHELAVEDAVKAHQRPKLEVYGDSLFVVLKTARFCEESEATDLGEIMCFIGEGFIVHVRHGEACALTGVRHGIEQRPDLLEHGPAAVLWAIIDHVVDLYVPVLDAIDDAIREVEELVFSKEAANPVERIYKLKREVLGLHSAVVPLVDPVERLATRQFPHVDVAMLEYFRDVHDHLLRVVAQVETFRELLTSVLEANLTRVSVRQNEDMRRISAWVAIAAVPTLVAGVYGMNFRGMPEIQSEWGYPSFLLGMAVVCTALFLFFRRRGWL